MPKTEVHMEDKNSKMERFFTACEELINCKFIIANSKISELLRAIATSEELMGLFTAVTKNFDYSAAKRLYLRGPEDTRTARGAAFLPAEDTELLAFVFCLLVEFDSGSLNLNDFLLRYFHEDGSYTASYALFVERVIRPFRDVIKRAYPHAGKGSNVMHQKREVGILETISEKISIERNYLGQLPLSKEDAYAGESILSELYIAIGRKDVPVVKALFYGYFYYLQVTGATSDNSTEMFMLASEL